MLTAAAVAAELGLSVRAVYALASTGRLVCYRFGAAVRFDAADVEAYKVAQPKTPPMVKPRYLREVARMHRVSGKPCPLTPLQMDIVASRHRRVRAAPWADMKAIRAIYAEAKRLTAETGVKHHVDHVIPLQGDFVSGLHVETNLCVLPAAENIRKHNKHEPC